MPALETILRYACPLAAAIAALAWPVASSARLRKGVVASLLTFAVIGGVWIYTEHHRRTKRYFNAYEHYHYALPTRYAAELGYTGLYDATTVALVELDRRSILPKKIRDLDSGRFAPQQTIVDRAPAVKARFTPERWEQFRAEVGWFAGRLGPATVSRVLQDKGYNASPVYGMVAGAFTTRVNVLEDGLLKTPFIDLTILLFTLATIARVFGVRVAAFVLTMLVTYPLTSHLHQKAALLRLDWICALLLSLCALKRGRYGLAGAATAYAAAIRVFPAIFGFAMLVRLIYVAVKERRLAKGPATFLASATATGLTLVAMTLPAVGIEGWRSFFHKVTEHNAQMAPWRVGFKYLLLGTWNGNSWNGLDPAVAAEKLGPVWGLCALASLGVAAWAMKHLDDVEAHAFSFAVAFILIAPTYYYWILVLIPALAFAARIDSRSHKVGLALLFVGGMVTHALLDKYDRTWGTFYVASVTLFVVVIWWAVTSLWQRSVKVQPDAPPLQPTWAKA